MNPTLYRAAKLCRFALSLATPPLVALFAAWGEPFPAFFMAVAGVLAAESHGHDEGSAEVEK